MPRSSVFIVASLLGCAQAASPLVEPRAAPPSAVVAQPAPARPAASVRELPVEGFLPALLYTPAGAEPARLIVTTHGAGGAPEWDCEYWRELTAGRAFVLSLRGKSMGGGSYYYPNHHELHAELVAAERAARAAEPRILPGGGVYSGYSQGASMGSAIVERHAAALPYVVLIEGFERWNIPRARAFQRAGGRRVLFACGTKQCDAVARDSARWIAHVGLEVRVEYAVGAGHTPAGEVMERVAGALDWLLRSE